jgi:RNA-directed DNA polymerase
MRRLGASEDVAKQVEGNFRRWWRNREGAIQRVLTIAYYERLGLPRLS